MYKTAYIYISNALLILLSLSDIIEKFAF